MSRSTRGLIHEPERVREEFDRIADAGYRSTLDASELFHDEMFAALPAHMERALDLGCGTGEIARRLAGRADHVLALDLSPRMIEIARERSAALPQIEYRAADLMTVDLPADSFDAVISVSTFHHVPLEPALARAASWVKPGGWLYVIDLFDPRGFGGFVYNATWWSVRRVLERTRPRAKSTPALQEAWRIHDAHDRHPNAAEVRTAARALPGARVRIRGLWRWTLAWQRPRR